MNRYAFIPQEIKRLNQWVCCSSTSKIPMIADTNKPASSSNPTTWSDYQTAIKAIKSKRYSDLGFVFNDNGIVGIDIDCGFDEYGLLNDLCVDIMASCRSYTEVSRSGRGVHILIKGDIPFKGKNNQKGVEIYKSSRYFIVTGNKLIYQDIIDNQDAIDYVLDKYFKEEVKDNSSDCSKRIYSPIYQKPTNGKIALNPNYPPIGNGMRNLSLTSLAGQLHTQGYSKEYILNELIEVNKKACDPPLDLSEVKAIANSISRYKR